MGDIVLRNGWIYDPLTKAYEQRDIGISGKKIVDALGLNENVQEIDVSGCLVTPGLIDYHIHLYSGSDGSVKADVMTFPSGVTTAVDGGTCGVSNFEMFAKTDIINSLTRIKSYLNVSSTGLATSVHVENVDPLYFEPARIKEIFSLYPAQLVALKLRISKNIVEPCGLTHEPLEKTLELADQLKYPVVVHMTDPVIPPEEAAAMLRPGDVFCHMYYGAGDTIVDGSGKVKPGILKARDRGVLFDACNGKNNFAFKTAIPAMKDGFYPDIISSDISPMTQYQQPVITLPRLLSKFMAMGMSLQEVFDAAILNPAMKLNDAADLATLKENTTADIAVFRLVEKDVLFFDLHNECISGTNIIVPQMTIKDGVVVYRQTDLD